VNVAFQSVQHSEACLPGFDALPSKILVSLKKIFRFQTWKFHGCMMGRALLRMTFSACYLLWIHLKKLVSVIAILTLSFIWNIKLNAANNKIRFCTQIIFRSVHHLKYFIHNSNNPIYLKWEIEKVSSTIQNVFWRILKQIMSSHATCHI